ncbi:MAG: type II toxin-antitoxin system RelE/ParE family toxin [Candidatus Kapabacteria bacterium]|nr:type II toxin-antitoxin system RelE/ParE family toxin [Ignavibacteriota bacterium]MCW5885661.1 type II toxin-antitoxin system RelE/ParE family toxin [Candidatus Kapabacteria bacterium]
MYKVTFLEPAENELKEAVQYYNKQLGELGNEFAEEVKKSIKRIIYFPYLWKKLSDRTRKCPCKRFPYNIIYFIDKKKIVIVAIMHSKRKPDYWKNRV